MEKIAIYYMGGQNDVPITTKQKAIQGGDVKRHIERKAL